MPRAIASTLILIILALLSVGCSPDVSEPPAGAETFMVDVLFREYYGLLKGEQVLGKAISALISDQSVKCQYTTNALMVFDPRLAGGDPFYLAPLGLKMNIKQPPEPKPADPQARYVDGFVIYPEFVSFYDKLGGVKEVGNPITKYQFITGEKRFEQ